MVSLGLNLYPSLNYVFLWLVPLSGRVFAHESKIASSSSKVILISYSLRNLSGKKMYFFPSSFKRSSASVSLPQIGLFQFLHPPLDQSRWPRNAILWLVRHGPTQIAPHRAKSKISLSSPKLHVLRGSDWCFSKGKLWCWYQKMKWMTKSLKSHSV